MKTNVNHAIVGCPGRSLCIQRRSDQVRDLPEVQTAKKQRTVALPTLLGRDVYPTKGLKSPTMCICYTTLCLFGYHLMVHGK